MKNKLIIFLAIFFLAAKCHKEEIEQTDNNGVVISKGYIWKQSLHLSDPVSNSGIYPVIYSGFFCSPITNGENNRLLALLDPENGEILWQWDDRYFPDIERIDLTYYHLFKDFLTYQVGAKSYCINLESGKTAWKIQRDKIFTNKITSYFNEYYFTYGPVSNTQNNVEYVAYRGNVNTGEITEFLRVNLSSEYVSPRGSVGGISYISTVPGNDNILLVTYAEPLPNWEVNSFFGLYNTQTKVWEWDRKLLSLPNVNTSVFTPPQVYKGKAYANVGKKIVCHDLATGEQLWSKQFTQDFMFSGFIIEEDKLIGSNEDEILYCLNPENGNIIWQTEGSGTSSRLSYLNGIVYFAGGGDGKLHGVDISNGKTVWLLDADNIDGTIFASYNPVYVFPAEGNQTAKVIAHTLGNVVCFEAYR